MPKYGVQLKFPATNNEVECEGILMRLRVKKALGAKNLLLQSDFKLLVRQIKEEYEAKEDRLQKYLKLKTIASPRPFTQWGIDIISPLPRGKR